MTTPENSSKKASESTEGAVAGNTSDHYLGERGREYFGWQQGGADFRSHILKRKFIDFCSEEITLVDFGCGGGFLLDKLPASRKIGIEINSAAREHAIEVFDIECFATPEEMPSDIADVVISNHALEHVPFPIGMLRELRRILKPGGTLVLCVPIDMQRGQERYDENDKNNHLHTWTAQLLGNTLKEAGFRVEQITHDGTFIPSGYTVFCYGRFPYWLYKLIGKFFSVLLARGNELIAVAKPLELPERGVEKS
jgi:2-polyprenyl-3-methyl-5-hydroxy-6-metoxy-1,4-benzoquinol methylase